MPISHSFTARLSLLLALCLSRVEADLYSIGLMPDSWCWRLCLSICLRPHVPCFHLLVVSGKHASARGLRVNDGWVTLAIVQTDIIIQRS